jgi:hypothetical protein
VNEVYEGAFMQLEVLRDAETVAGRAAAIIAENARALATRVVAFLWP